MSVGSTSLSDAEVKAFHADGFHFPIDPLTEEEAERARIRCEEYLGLVDRLGGFFSLHRYFPKLHLFNLWAYEIVKNERILDAVRSLIGPDLLVWSTQLFQRKADHRSSLAWHQDSVYYGLDGVETKAVRVWVALTPATTGNGTMRFARASHLLGPQEHGYGADKMRGEEVRMDISPDKEVVVELRAGQASMHNLLVAHCSGINTSGADRFNFSIDYLVPSVVPNGPHSALLVSGRDEHGNFQPETPPSTDFGEAELGQAMKTTLQRLRLDMAGLARSRTRA